MLKWHLHEKKAQKERKKERKKERRREANEVELISSYLQLRLSFIVFHIFEILKFIKSI